MKRRLNEFPLAYRSFLPALAAVSGLAVCLLSLWAASYAGMARLLALYGKTKALPAATAQAVRFSPTDPEARYAHAAALLSLGQREAALPELERAVALRPRYYGLWLELAQARDLAGDDAGAAAAFRQAVELAPHYAQPRWRLGNLLLRQGQVEEAFVEIRQAAARDATLLSRAVDLAWGAAGGDLPAVEQLLQPQTSSTRLELAIVLARQGQAEDALRWFRAAPQATAAERQRLLTELLAARSFPAAFAVWAAVWAAGQDTAVVAPGGLVDGGFERGFTPEEASFGWQRAPDAQTLRLTLDTRQPHSGRASLRLEWRGAADPATALLTQLIVVAPQRRYRLSFAARTQELVTGGLPVVLVVDAASDGRLLVPALPLAAGGAGWQSYAMEFTTGETTQAVRLLVRRQDCAAGPCPAFGTLWLDDFTLDQRQNLP